MVQYRDVDSRAAKVVALLRNQFGGHPIQRDTTPERTDHA